ncbi:MAG: hypothetical protein ACFFCM_20125 [Promethearchaeota archaeon]
MVGLIIIGIILGVSQPSSGGGFAINEGAIVDLLILKFIIDLPEDDPLRTILLVLWFLGFFTASSEE